MIPPPTFFDLIRVAVTRLVPPWLRCGLRGHDWSRGYVVLGVRVTTCHRCAVADLHVEELGS